MVKKSLLFLVLLLVTICIASAFQFSPLEQTFEPTGEKATQVYTIVNDSDDTIAIRLSVFKRDQDSEGNEVRTDASPKFIISPSSVFVYPQSTTVVRVQYRSSAPVLTVEESYRLIAEQIPYSQGKSESTQSMFNFLYVYATSLYVSPSEAKISVDIPRVRARVDKDGNQVMDITIRNSGNVHQILLDAELTITGSSGSVTLTESEQLPGVDSINVLARKAITKTIPWPEGLEFVEGGSYKATLKYSN